MGGEAMRVRSSMGLLFGAVSSLALAPQALAQSAGAGSEATSLSEVIVTAQKREQALIDVPMAISAVGGEELARRGVSTIEDLQYSVPGLSITQFSPGQQRVQLRGVSVFSGLPTVGVYLDELPLNLEFNQSGQDVRLLDIKRVEVLRGPQGTLYGQGAVGGTIRYITNDVDLGRFGGSASGEVADVRGGGVDWKAEGVLNAPLAPDRLGVRIAASYQRFGGWIDNPVLGERNVNDGHALTLRGKVGWQVTDELKITLLAQHQDLDVGAQNLSDANQQVFDRVPTPFKSKATLLTATASYDLGFATLLSATGYIDRKDRTIADLTPALSPFLPLFGVPAGAVQGISLAGASRNEIFTEEVRLASNGSGPLGWTIGGFYRKADTRNVSETTVTPDVLPPGFKLLSARGTSPENSRSWAVFGEATYALTPSLTALVGLRYFEDRRVQDVVSTTFGASAVDQGRETFNALSPRFNLSWQPDRRVNLYANVAKGFRSGGFNRTSLGGGLGQVPPTYDPDMVWTYEVGGKFQSTDRTLAAEFAVYRNVWTDVQTTTNLVGLPTNFTTNGGKLAGWGVDGSVSYSPIAALTLTLTGGWNNMEYKSNSADHRAGDRADYVPRFTGSASAEYRFDVGAWPGFARVDYQYADHFQVYARNFQVAPAKSQDQNILNARIGVSGAAWTASVFARNLLNRDSVIYPAFAALIYPARLQPRAVGVTLSFNY